MSEKEILAYTAGIVDGEGTYWRGKCLTGDKRPFLQSRIVVCQKERELLDWLKEQWGGGITINNKMSIGVWRSIFRWSLNGKKAEELAIKLLPYTIVKREQIKRLLPETMLRSIPEGVPESLNDMKKKRKKVIAVVCVTCKQVVKEGDPFLVHLYRNCLPNSDQRMSKNTI